MSYNSEIKATENPDIDDFIKAATDNVPPSLRERPWACDYMNHGKSVLNNEEQLNCYMAAYGEMHKQKMERILADFPYQDIKGNFEIFDW